MKSIVKLVVAVVLVLAAIASTAGAVKEYQFDGTTGQQLATAIATNGAGTYHINGKVTISQTLTVSTAGVKLMSDVPHNPGDSVYGLDTVGVFDITMSSGNAVVLTGVDTAIDGILFQQSATSTAYMLVLQGYNQAVSSCAFYLGDGVGVDLDNAWFVQINNLKMEAHSSNLRHGTGIASMGSGGHEIMLNDVYIVNTFCGLYGTCYSGLYFYDFNSLGCSYGMYFAPASDTSCYDLVMSECVIDTFYTRGMYNVGTYRLNEILMSNCWIGNGYITSALIGMDINKAINVVITGGFFDTEGLNTMDTFRLQNINSLSINGAKIAGAGDAIDLTGCSNVIVIGNVISAGVTKIRQSGCSNIVTSPNV